VLARIKKDSTSGWDAVNIISKELLFFDKGIPS
jgi:hypothetical protein